MQKKQRGRSRPEDKYRINEKITADEVRVISEDNKMLGVMKLKDALRLKDESGLDIVVISPGIVPPVCKIIDYGKFLYQQEKKRKEVKKNQKNVQLKEIKMRPKTDVHDYDFKIKHAKEFLSKGNKVKITIKFRGREMAFVSLGRERIERIIEDTKDIARVEVSPKLEGRNLQMVLGPKAQVSKSQNTKEEKDKGTEKKEAKKTTKDIVEDKQDKSIKDLQNSKNSSVDNKPTKSAERQLI